VTARRLTSYRGAARARRPASSEAASGRIPTGPAPEVVEAGFALEGRQAALLHRGFALADLAQTLALARAGVTPPSEGRRLARALLEMAAVPPEEFPYDPAMGDPWVCWHRELARRVGAAAGWLRLGRPRRETGRVAFRIALRGRVLSSLEATVVLGEALLARAKEHRETVMPDYTYLQPAQPTTFGYLLLGYLQPLLRDGERIRRAHAWVNRSPAGAGGVAGASVEVDRRYLAELLGFDGPIPHARDATWQWDGLVELLAVTAGCAVHLGQVATDLELFASPPFGFIELADAFSRPSALMPQKKNPYPLSVVRGVGGAVAGTLAGLLSVLRTGSARTDHFLFAYELVPGTVELFERSARLLAGVVRTMSVATDVMRARAAEGFLGAADLAQELTLGAGLGYEDAHRLVGAAVREAVSEGRSSLVGEDLKRAARALGVPLPRDEAWLEGVVARSADPEALLGSRRVLGGAARGPFGAMLREAARALRAERRWLGDTRSRVTDAERRLLRLAKELATGPSPSVARRPRPSGGHTASTG
jgi:argininosuccinate lyase